MANAARSWSDFEGAALIVLLVSAIYGTRLDQQPIVGEESRWASGAREMLATGDWIVPRQQGRVFAERPPMTMWAMAAVGWIRGDVDSIAVRLPSVIAVVLTALLVFGYARAFLSTFGALAAALVYATMGQVLQIGRMGESEALFTLLVSASLLFWHLGYVRGWNSLFNWSIGFAFAALAALVKGPQAPVYFVAITGAYLIARRDWRYLARWQYLAGVSVFAVILAAWQIPFYLATDISAVQATWTGLATDRVRLDGMAKHIFTYPLETFACLLPWSPLLVALAHSETRELLQIPRIPRGKDWVNLVNGPQSNPHLPPPYMGGERLWALVSFLLVAVAVAYPTVWLVAGARGRYFMPLYPLIAVLIGTLIEQCSVAELGRYPRRAWHQFMLLSGTLVGVSGLAVGVLSVTAAEYGGERLPQQRHGLAFSGAACLAVLVLWFSFRMRHPAARMAIVIVVAAVTGLAYTGIVMDVRIARANDPSAIVSRFKDLIPQSTPLVSLSPIDHRFAYYYQSPLPELDWPRKASDVPEDVDYFCFMRYPGDTADRRQAGRGRSWTTTPGTLPFAWEEVTSICVERRLREVPQRTVVLGRVIRPIREDVSDVTVASRPPIADSR